MINKTSLLNEFSKTIPPLPPHFKQSATDALTTTLNEPIELNRENLSLITSLFFQHLHALVKQAPADRLTGDGVVRHTTKPLSQPSLPYLDAPTAQCVARCFQTIISQHFGPLSPDQLFTLATPNNDQMMLCPVSYLGPTFPLTSDHIPTGVEIRLTNNIPPDVLDVISWNMNGVEANQRWLVPTTSPEFALYEAYTKKNLPLPNSCQGLDGSVATLPFKERFPLATRQVQQLLPESVAILALQEVGCSFIQHFLDNPQQFPHHSLLVVKTPNKRSPYGEQCLFYRTRTFQVLASQEDPVHSLKHQVIQRVVLQHLDSLQKLQIVNVHIPGAPNQAIETKERRQFADYLLQLAGQSPDDWIVATGDMNASPEVMRIIMKIGQRNIPFSLIKSGYPTNFDPYNQNGQFYPDEERTRDVKEIDMALVSIPKAAFTALGRGGIVAPLAIKKMPPIVVAALQSIIAGHREWQKQHGPLHPSSVEEVSEDLFDSWHQTPVPKEPQKEEPSQEKKERKKCVIS